MFTLVRPFLARIGEIGAKCGLILFELTIYSMNEIIEKQINAFRIDLDVKEKHI